MEIEKAIENIKEIIYAEDRVHMNYIDICNIFDDECENFICSIETVLKELEKKDKMIESVKDRIEYYLMGNSTLNDFNVREKELERLLKVLNKAEESE